MRRLGRNIFQYILFVFLFYVVTLFFWVSYLPRVFRPNVIYPIGSYGHTYSRLLEVKNTKNIDILFLGSSHAYRGFDVRKFTEHKMRSFNLGSISQTPIQTKVLLDRYLINLNPKIVVYEVYPATFEIDGVESSMDIIANDRNDMQSFFMTLKTNNIKTYNTFIYGLTRDLFNLNSYLEPTKVGLDTYISGGFVEREIRCFKSTELASRNIVLNEKQLKAFSEIVRFLKNKDIELILVYAPITKHSYRSYSNNRSFDSIMESYSKYYNFNEIISLNDSLHFYDEHHLNQNGVEVFNNKLIELLDKGRTK
jgi:hypothetical protein